MTARAIAPAALALALATTAAPAVHGDDSPRDGQVRRFSLSNGLGVVLSPDARSSVVGMQLRYRAGTRDDPEARPGLVSLVQRLMLRRTEHVGEWQYARLIIEAGGSESHAAEADRTKFSVSLPAERIALPLWLWSDQMGFLAGGMDDREIEQEAAVLRTARLQSVDNVPAGRVTQLAMEAIYPASHPYRATGWPTDTSLAGLTAREVRAFVETHFAPNDATLVVTGDFDPQRARALIERYFDSLPPRRIAERRAGRPADPRRRNAPARRRQGRDAVGGDPLVDALLARSGRCRAGHRRPIAEQRTGQLPHLETGGRSEDRLARLGHPNIS